jgi:S1-C subfamily serine protease
MGDELMQTMQEVDSTPRLIVECMTSTLAGRRFAFTATDLRHGVLLGRASDCHVRFDAGKDLKVSGHHALIDERDGKIMVRDQGSSNGLFLNDVRVTSSGSAVLSGSKLSLGQEGAVMKLLLPGAPAKTTQALQAAAMAAAAAPAAATGTPERPPLKPAPGSTTTPAAPAQSAPPAPLRPTPQPASESARRGMPSVQTDPALLSKKDSSIDRVVEQAGSQVGAGAKTKYLIKEVAEQLDARSRRKSGALMTVIGALVLLLLAAGAIAVWYVMEQQKKDEKEKEQHSAEEKVREKEIGDIRKDVDSMKASNDAVAKMAADMESFRREQEKKLEEVAKKYGGSSEGQDALLKRLKEVEDTYAKDRAALEKKYSEEKEQREADAKKALEEAKNAGREVPSEQAFRDIADKYNASVFMVWVQFPLLDKDGNRVSIQQGSGTGWLARNSEGKGWVVTNKHVIMPYMFKADLAISYAVQDLRPDPDMKNWIIACWPSGSKLRSEAGSNQLDVAEAWACIPGDQRGGRGTLTVKGFADNEWNPDAPAAEMLAANGFKTDFPQEVLDRVGALKIHKMDTANDLCVLELDRLDKKFLVTPLEMASDDDLGKLHQLDPVMALGYPLGLSVIQSSTATTSPATGVIRSLQRDVSAIGVSVPIIPGNSGGPLIDRRGKVIGITTRTFEATLGVAITVDHARKLLDRLAK